MKILKLVPPPAEDVAIREATVQLLAQALDEAKAGHIAEIVLLVLHPDGTWSDRTTQSLHFSEWIGRLEMTKLDWIKSHWENCSEN